MRVVGNHLQMEIEMFVMVVLGSDNELHIAGTSQILKFLDKSVLENLFLNALKAWTISIQDSRGRPIFEGKHSDDFKTLHHQLIRKPQSVNQLMVAKIMQTGSSLPSCLLRKGCSRSLTKRSRDKWLPETPLIHCLFARR